jgi:hypothetical protein
MSDYETTYVLDPFYLGITALVGIPLQAAVLALAHAKGGSTTCVCVLTLSSTAY